MSKRFLIPLAVVAVVATAVLLIWLSGSEDRGIDSATGPASPTGPGEAVATPDAPPPTSGRFPVKGRVVRLGSSTAVADASVSFAGAEAVTDAEGRFGLPDVPAGEHALRVTAEGFDELRRDLAARPDLGDLALRSPTVLVVTVTDVNGRAIPGATVRTIDRTRFETGEWWEGPAEAQIATGQVVLEDGKEPPGDRFTADESGIARIEGLTPGTYYVDAAAAGFATAGADVVLAVDAEATADLILDEGVSISGRVVDVARRASPGARILAIPWSDAVEFPYTATEATTGGDDGSFTIGGLSRGIEYLLFARAGNGQIGLAMQIEAPKEDVEVICGPRFRLRGTVVDDETGEPLAGVHLFTILGTATSDEQGAYDLAGMVKSPFFRYVWLRKEGYESQDAEIEASSSFLGGPVVSKDFRMTKYRPATVRALVRDTTGNPVAGATVLARKWGEEGDGHATAVTDSAGEATLAGVKTGGVQVLARKDGYVHVQVARDQGGQNWANPSDGDWTRTEPGEEVRVSLVLATSAGLTGTVRDEQGNPLADVGIVVGQIRAGTTGEDGTYEVEGLPRNFLCAVGFSREGYAHRSETITAGTTNVLDVVLSLGAGISGVVVDEAGKPLGGTSVSAYEDDSRWPSQTGVTTKDGAFELSGLEVGTWVLEFERGGYVPVRTPKIALGEGQRRENLRIVLPVGSEIRLWIEAPDGTRTPGMALVYGPLDRPEEERLTVGEPVDEGEPAVFRLTRGRYRVLATSSGGITGAGAAETEMDLGGEPEVVVRLSDRPSQIRVRLVLPEGGRVAGIQVSRTDPKIPEFELWFSEEEEGIYASPPLLPGKYHLEVYYQKPGTENAWYSYERDDVSPGPDPIEVDLTK